MTQTIGTMLLALLTDMIHLRPFAPDAVGKLVGLPVYPIAAESNVYFTVYRSSASATNQFFSSLEIRTPTENNRGKGGMVIAEIGPKDVKFAEIISYFGKPATRDRGSPHRLDSLIYYVYPQAWGTLKLGATKDLLYLRLIVLEAATDRSPAQEATGRSAQPTGK